MENELFLQQKYLIDKISKMKPFAFAEIKGSNEYDTLFGMVSFYQVDEGYIVSAIIENLPSTKTNIFGFHIHENGECNGDFSSAGNHYGGDEHPNHKGDMPSLFSCNGEAFLMFYTNRITGDEILNRSVIIHLDPDDFTTQPSGNSGKRIACGVIKRF